MPFTLLVCGDLFSNKVNLEIPFPERPTLAELQNHVQNVFTAEMFSMPKPPGPVPESFVISRMQIYDDVQLIWVNLTSPAQLHEYDQLYCFQPSAIAADDEKDLPAPRLPSKSVPFTPGTPQPLYATPPAMGGSQYGVAQAAAPAYPAAAAPQHQPQVYSQPQQAAMTSGLPQPTGLAAMSNERANVPLDERIRVSFQELDEAGKGWVDSAELERSFRNRGVDFSANTVHELFVKADQPREGRIDLNKWHIFAQIYPNTVDAVYYRGRDIRDEELLRQQIAASQAELDAGRAKEQELRNAADAQAQHNQRLMAALQDQEGKLRSATDRRNLLEAQERALIEQEVKLERQKDALRVSVNKFKETANAFDRDAAQSGSPRRSRAPVTDFTGL